MTELIFAKSFGVNTFSFTRGAKASASPATRIGGTAPLGVDYEQLSEAIARGDTEHIYLKYGAGDGEEGSYGAIDLDGVKGGGANDFSTWLTYGYNGTIEVGDDLLPVEKGNMDGPTARSINERYNACTHYADDGGCSCAHYELTCPRVLKVLVIEKIGCSYVKVKGFAAFVLEGEAGDKGEVLGSYVKYLEPGESLVEDAWDSADFGIYNVGLTK
ncbi:hypothetical protein SDC9_139093 [bioreactor metagenome]|uniref:Uncharacterized protein n=1 Tax=bioreactor metagenome TaxID=1076179 RepID=A0A645DRS0_9ZZZZ